MSGHGLAWFAADWRQMCGRGKQCMGGVIWVRLTWGETGKSKHRGPLRSSTGPSSWRPLSHSSSLWLLPATTAQNISCRPDRVQIYSLSKAVLESCFSIIWRLKLVSPFFEAICVLAPCKLIDFPWININNDFEKTSWSSNEIICNFCGMMIPDIVL